MPESKKPIMPERAEHLIFSHDPIHVHNTHHFRLFSAGPSLENFLSILKHGLVSPPLADKIERKTGKKMFEFAPYAGTDWWSDGNLSKDIDAHPFSLNWADSKGIPLYRVIQGFRRAFSNQSELPAIIFSKPGHELMSSRRRIQPRFFVGIILPKQEEFERGYWIDAIKRHFAENHKSRPAVPIYDHTGKLIWKPEEREVRE